MMQKNNLTNSALLLIDIQKGFEDIEYWGGDRNNPDAEEKAGKLLTYWRQNEWSVFHVKHCSTIPQSPLVKGKPGNDFNDLVKPIDNEVIIEKDVNSAFIGTNLQEQLDKSKIKQLVIAGLTTDHCISTSTRMAGNFGYEVFLVNDATATSDKVGLNGEKYKAQLIHDTALASLHNEFAKVVNTIDIIKL